MDTTTTANQGPAPPTRVPTGAPVTVVGAGVIGLTVAHELAVAGYRVSMLAEDTAQQSVSSVAGGMWFPYRVGTTAETASVLERSQARFLQLVKTPAAPVELRAGIYVERVPEPDRAWTDYAVRHQPADPSRLPAGASSGVRAMLPFIETPAYLKWLQQECARLGVGIEYRRVRDVTDAAANGTTGDAAAVVVAAGLGAGALLGDDETVVPVRGQVLRLANPGLRDWYVDSENPEGPTYVVPRDHDVVCGGTAEEGQWGTDWDDDVGTAILDRVTAVVPELAGAQVLGRSVGLRPARPTLRIESVPGHPVPVVTCYGHGGAGLTLSWGSAELVAEILAGLIPAPGK